MFKVITFRGPLWGLHLDFRTRVSAPLSTSQQVSPYLAQLGRGDAFLLALSDENLKYPSCLTFNFMLSLSLSLSLDSLNLTQES